MRPRRCRRRKRTWPSTGSWPPSCRTGTAPAWLARWATSASGSRRWAVRPRRCRATQEAADIYRQLAAELPDRYRGDLAHAQADLGIRLSALGRAAEALPPTQEAADIYRQLAAELPDGTGATWPAPWATSASGSRRWAVRPRRCRRRRKRLTSTGSWPPPCRTGTAPAWPASWPVSAAGSLSWATWPRRCRRSKKLWPSTGSWPPSCRTGTAPAWPARWPG